MSRRRFVVWERLPAILTSAEVCEILGICDNTLITYRKKRGLNMRRVGRTYQIDRDALRAWLENGAA